MTILLLTLLTVVIARAIYLYCVDKMSDETLTICTTIVFVGAILNHSISLIGCGV